MIVCRRRNGVAVLAIDHPPVNATSQAVRQGLLDGVTTAVADPEVTAIVIVGNGTAFSAGGDVRELGDASRNSPSLRETIAVIEASPKPVVAAMHGYALGGGFELALGCNARIAAPSLRLGLPEVTLGVIPGAGGTQRLPRLVGAVAALDIITSGRHLDAGEALRLGIVDAIVEGKVEDAALDFLSGNSMRRRVCEFERAPSPVAAPGLFDDYRRRHEQAWDGLLAPWKAVDAIESFYTRSAVEAAEIERAAYLDCQRSPQRAALSYVFTARRSQRKSEGVIRSSDIERRLRMATGRSASDCRSPTPQLIRALSDEGVRLLHAGIALSEEQIDIIAVDRLAFPSHLGGPMYWRRKPCQ